MFDIIRELPIAQLRSDLTHFLQEAPECNVTQPPRVLDVQRFAADARQESIPRQTVT